MVVLGLGVDPTAALVLSFGILFALIPLVMFTSNRAVMGTLVNHRLTTAAAVVVAALIIGLNGFLIMDVLVGG